jgi:hypothetical protein
LGTLRIAKSLGDVSALLPPGIDSVWDLPHNIHDAISQGLVFIGFDELSEEERPPRNIWLDPELLTEHFANLKRERKEKAEGRAIEDPVQNAAAKDLIVGL